MSQDALPPSSKPQPDYRMRDYLNSRTGSLSCRFLEWSSWYSQGVRNRLIGHYRLYNLFRKNYEKIHLGDISITQSYILHYRTIYPVKHFVARITSFLIATLTRSYAPVGEYAEINRHLIRERPDILREFLVAADSQFETALDQAIQQILGPNFLRSSAIYKEQLVIIQYNEYRTNIQYNDNRTNIQYNDNRTSNQYNDNRTNQYNDNHNESHTNNQYNSQFILQSHLREGAQGKEKGVFSKKQHLLLFDLLSEKGGIERIDFSKPARFESIANLFHAISGKSASSMVGELNDHRNKSLYKCNTPGEFDQLISTLTNLADAFRAAGFRSIVERADVKIEDLKRQRQQLNPPNP